MPETFKVEVLEPYEGWRTTYHVFSNINRAKRYAYLRWRFCRESARVVKILVEYYR